MGIFPNFRGEKNKYVKPPPRKVLTLPNDEISSNFQWNNVPNFGDPTAFLDGHHAYEVLFTVVAGAMEFITGILHKLAIIMKHKHDA